MLDHFATIPAATPTSKDATASTLAVAPPIATSVPAPPTATTPASGRETPRGKNRPAAHLFKDNARSMIYHVPGGAFYRRTTPEDCLATRAVAEAAGYRASQR